MGAKQAAQTSIMCHVRYTDSLHSDVSTRRSDKGRRHDGALAAIVGEMPHELAVELVAQRHGVQAQLHELLQSAVARGEPGAQGHVQLLSVPQENCAVAGESVGHECRG